MVLHYNKRNKRCVKFEEKCAAAGNLQSCRVVVS